MILIVDDKQENVFSLRTVLEQNGFETDSALSGEEALKKVLKHEYALIILDVQMPLMDGFEVAEAIGGLNKTRDIPIIFLSAVNTDKKFITKGFETGAVEYLTKPVDPDILTLKVRNFYRLYEKNRALKEAERELTATIKELNTTLEALPQLAFTADNTGNIVKVNKQWLDYAPSTDDYPETPDGFPSFKAQWLQTIEKGDPVEYEIQIKKIANSQFYYHLLRSTPVVLHGRVQRWVSTITSIHDQKMQNEILESKVAERTSELVEMNRTLEVSNHELQQFASVASHDLKEPLRKIRIFGSRLSEKSNLDANLQSYLDKIIGSSERMSNLIEDLLSFARLSSPDIFKVSDINEILDGIISDLEMVIELKQAEISIQPIPKLEVISGLVRQLFQNIISNALKFSRPGVPPKIVIQAARINEPFAESNMVSNGKYCRITISDNGIGFDEKYSHKIFTIFQRLATQHDYEGTGIGLAIAKKIIDRHNGFITATSKPGHGSVFFIVLPVVHHPVHASNDINQQNLSSL